MMSLILRKEIETSVTICRTTKAQESLTADGYETSVRDLEITCSHFKHTHSERVSGINQDQDKTKRETNDKQEETGCENAARIREVIQKFKLRIMLAKFTNYL